MSRLNARIGAVARRVFVPDVLGVEMMGDSLTNRLRLILDGATVRRASRARIVSTIAICAMSSVLFAAATMVPQDAKNAQTNPPRFDVVSIKPCAPGEHGQSRGAGGVPITSPGRLYLQCYPLSTLFQEAYIFFADGRAHGLNATLDVGVEGQQPDWIKSERYTIEANTSQTAAPAVMRGPMLQAVLEDRFKLKVRHVTREMPVYELVVGKSGAKVAPYTGHDCVIKDNAVWPPIALPAGQVYCGDRSKVDGDRFIRQGVMTLDELASLFAFDRPVVNRTGITAPVSYRVEVAKEDAVIGREAAQAAWIGAIRSQLGLDVRPSKGPRDFLVIDHVEKPTPNEVSATGRRR